MNCSVFCFRHAVDAWLHEVSAGHDDFLHFSAAELRCEVELLMEIVDEFLRRVGLDVVLVLMKCPGNVEAAVLIFGCHFPRFVECGDELALVELIP